MKTASVGGVQRCGFHSGPVLERDLGGGGGGGKERGLRVRYEDKSGAFFGRNEGEWRAVISQEIRDGRGRQAVGMYEEMMRQRVAETSPHTLIALLRACGSAGDLETAKRMHAEVVRSGFESHLFVSTALVDAYMKCRSVADARHAFEAMPHRDAVSWTAMILGLAEMGKGEEALQIYSQMQQQQLQREGGGLVADAQTYVAALKACRAALEGPEEAEEGASKDREGRCLKMVRSIHSDMVEKGGLQLGRGSGAMVVLGNMLVDVYARCGSLEDARRVFDQLPGRDVVSWNMMISGYAGQRRGGKGGGPQEALRLYRRMRQVEGVAPDARTYVAALKACSKLEEAGPCGSSVSSSLEAVRAVHADVKESGKHNLYVENMLVDVYAKCGRLEEARRVFDEMPRRDVVCWNSMISGYAQMGKAEEALQLYRRMREEGGVAPDARTFVAALKACSSRLAGGESAGSGADSEVEEDKARCVEVVRAVHADAAASSGTGGEPLDVTNVFVGSLLVDVYAKCGRVEEARRVFERMARRNVVSWNSLILGYAQMGMGEEALQVYSRMQAQGGTVVPNARTHVGALKACSSIMQAAAGAAAERGDDAAAACVTWRRQRSRCLEIARGIDSCYNNNLKDGNAFVDTMLVDVYGKCGRVEDARRVFDGMGQRQQRDVVAWSAMILAYAQSEEGEHHHQEALRLYKMLVAEQQVVGNSQMFVGALTACGRMAALDEGRQVHADMRRAAVGVEAVEAEALVTVALIDMYAKCGSMAEARQVFDGTAMASKRNVTAWNALLRGYARVGEVEAVFALLDRMMMRSGGGEEGGVRPNGVTFLGVLTACSHAGLVDRGRDYLRLMSCPSSGYGIAPGVNHLACMVDLLGRAGRLDEALAAARSMPDPVPAAVWKSVLGACRMHAHAHGGGGGAVDIARHAFRCAVQGRPDDAAPYVLMANVYSAAGMEEAARATQARRLAAQAWKTTRGESRWTDPAGRTHVFAAGDAPSQGAQVRRMQAETDPGWKG